VDAVGLFFLAAYVPSHHHPSIDIHTRLSLAPWHCCSVRTPVHTHEPP
jgi:hypothetical protein